ncbi:MAG: TonB-dependent receptor [Bryobacterales bacterium]|nr:TonB-dependent receptor [Bryobacterales bacterium]MBV9399234.1 TonB-dependent receptor [Bryobacterales bacterium]
MSFGNACAPICAASLALLFTSSQLLSQGSSGRIFGNITDQSGGSVAGATVTVTDIERGASRTMTTDIAGAYSAPNLTPGTYAVRVEFQGFKVVDRRDIPLGVAQEIRLDLSLEPGQQTQTVTVTGEPPAINTANAELGGTLQNEVINDLPLNGRNFQNLLDLRPGVTKYPGNSGWTQSTNGLRPHDNFFMVDGINSNDPWMAQSMMNAVMAAGDAGTILPIDAIDEFKTQQNPRAEYGWKPGSVVNVGVKSGSNQLHGTAFAFGRTDSWDAKEYFADSVPPLSLQQFGGSLGGAVFKDKLFFFGNFEQQRYSVGNPVDHEVPITAAGVGPAAQNLIGACNAARTAGTLTALSAQLAGLSLSCAPQSNYPGLFPVNNGPTTHLGTALASTNQINSGLGKLDYHLNSKHTFSGLYFISPGDGVFVDNPTLEIAAPWLTSQYARSQVGSGSWTWVPNSTWVNSLRAGYSHYYQTFRSVDANQNPANYAYNGSTYHLYTGQTNPAYFGLPTLAFQGGYSFQLGLGWPKTVGPDGVWQFSDSVSWLHGNHTVKFGGEALVLQSTSNVTANTKGPMRFNGLQNFFSGNMNRALFTAGDFLRHLQNEAYGVFIQDDWRITRRLTVNLGLRYELNTVFKERDNLIGNFDPNQGLVQAGKQIGTVFNGDHNNFAPRLGFAWDVFGDGRTVVRASGGILYEQGSYDSFMALGNLLGLRTVPTGVNLYTNGNATPTTAGGTINLGAITFTGPALGSVGQSGTVKYNYANNGPNTPIYSAAPACGDGTVTLPSGLVPQPCVVLGVDRNLRTPYISTWNVGIQRALTNSLALDVSYVGNHATKLIGLTDLNQPRLVNGFSPGWGNPADPNSPAGQCVASAPAYDNCNPDGAAEQAARPYNGKFPYLSYIYWLSNSNFSNYNALQVSATQRLSHGLSFVMGYTFAHSQAMSPDNWRFLNPIDSNNVRALYGNSEFDMRHRFTLSTTYLLPGVKTPGQFLNGWSINSILTLQSALPWGVNDATTDFSGTGEINNASTIGEQWNFFGNPADFKSSKAWLDSNGGQSGIPYFAGTSNPACLAKSQAMGSLAVASLANLGCYAVGKSILIPPAFGSYGTLGPNVFRGFPFYNWDLSVTKVWKYKERLTAQFRAEFFNVLNHPNISNPFGGAGGDNTYTDPSGTGGASFGFRPETPDVTSSNPVLGSGGPRAIQLGLKLIF